jgi:hypothetical protein
LSLMNMAPCIPLLTLQAGWATIKRRYTFWSLLVLIVFRLRQLLWPMLPRLYNAKQMWIRSKERPKLRSLNYCIVGFTV